LNVFHPVSWQELDNTNPYTTIERHRNTKASDTSGNRAVPDAGYQPTDDDLCTDENDPGRGECAL
jgi:hypothetical protein